MIFGCIEHQTWAFIRGSGDFSVDEVTEGIVTVVYRGMAAPRVASPKTASPAGALTALDDAVQRVERAAARMEHALQVRREPKAS
jgi:TetR/AcrR family transcriptional regulator, fatty acid metabolism regulator protein